MSHKVTAGKFGKEAEEEGKQRTGKKGGCGSSGARPAAGAGGGLVQLTAEEDDDECRQGKLLMHRTSTRAAEAGLLPIQ